MATYGARATTIANAVIGDGDGSITAPELRSKVTLILKAVGINHVVDILNRGKNEGDPDYVVANEFADLTDAQLAEAFVVKIRMALQDMLRKGAVDEARATNVTEEQAAGDAAAAELG